MATKKKSTKSALPAGAPDPSAVGGADPSAVAPILAPGQEEAVKQAAKPGWRTSEFWITAGAFFIAAFGNELGIDTNTDPNSAQSTAREIFEWVAAGAAGVAFIISRLKVKQALAR
jgi:hypothetical protein